MTYQDRLDALRAAGDTLAECGHDPDCQRFKIAADAYLAALDAHERACNHYTGSILVPVRCHITFVAVEKDKKRCVDCCYCNLHDCEREGEAHPECRAEYREDGREGIFVAKKKKPGPQPGLGSLYRCPRCKSHMRARVLGGEKRCWNMVPRVGPRAKGEPRMVQCNTVMVYHPEE